MKRSPWRSAQGVDLRPEDDGVVVPVGVEQAHRPGRGGQCRLDQREHRGDAAAGAEGHHVAVPAGAEEPGGPGHLEDVARRQWSFIQLDTTPPGVRLTVTRSSGSTAGDEDIE